MLHPKFQEVERAEGSANPQVYKQLIPTAQRFQSALQCELALQVIPSELEGFCFDLGGSEVLCSRAFTSAVLS